MPAQVYECMLLLDTTKVAGDIQTAADQLHGILEKHSAELLASRPWDERRLAYQIGNHKKGLYYLTYFRVESTSIPAIEREFQLNENIIRFLTLKIDPKLVETMLTLARDEHAMVALHSLHDEQDEDGREPRRPRRRAEKDDDFDSSDEEEDSENTVEAVE